jgi:hypothetical protein
VTSPILLGVGLVLSTATQLRWGESPVGPGELLLALWMLDAGLRLVLQRGRVTLNTPQLRPITLFWICNWALMIAGGVIGYRQNLLGTAKAAHDTLAFIFVTSFCLLVVLQSEMSSPMRLTRTALSIVGAASLLIIAAAYTRGRIGPVDLWFGDRLTGWSENPNQLVQLVVPMPFLSLYLARRARSPDEQLLMFALLAIGLVVGLLIKSDAVVVGWTAGFTAAFVLGVLNISRLPARDPATVMALRVVFPLIIMSLVGLLLAFVIDDLLRMYNTMVMERGQGAVRFVLWMHGLQAMLLSPYTGFGPGAHSGLLGPLQGKEAHNSLLDWGTSTGFTGLLLLITLFLVLFRPVWRARSPALLGAFVALVVFIQFDYSLRQPVFWFWLLIVPGLAYAAGPPRRVVWSGSAALPEVNRQVSTTDSVSR